jgi:hypothetical protein
VGHDGDGYLDGALGGFDCDDGDELVFFGVDGGDEAVLARGGLAGRAPDPIRLGARLFGARFR